MSTALLLAEPEPAERGLLVRHLTDDGFEVVDTAEEGEALELAERSRPDLVLLGSGFEDGWHGKLCRRLREGEPGRTWDRDVPVIVLGDPEADAVDRVRAFARGCDDYLARPFHYDELLARIHAVLRRVATAPGAAERIEAGAIVLDRSTRTVRVAGEAVVLAGKEFELLAKLGARPHHVFPKEELLRDVWGIRSLVHTRTLDSHASRLRCKLGRSGAGPFVLNAWGVGYRLLAD